MKAMSSGHRTMVDEREDLRVNCILFLMFLFLNVAVKNLDVPMVAKKSINTSQNTVYNHRVDRHQRRLPREVREKRSAERLLPSLMHIHSPVLRRGSHPLTVEKRYAISST